MLRRAPVGPIGFRKILDHGKEVSTMERSNRVAAAVIGISVAVLLGLSIYALQARQNGNFGSFGDSSPTPFSQSVFAQRVLVPEGTAMSVRLGTTLSTKTANVG